MSIKISYSNLGYQTKYEECRKNLEAKIWIFFVFAVCWTEAHGKYNLCCVLPWTHANKNGPDGAWRENYFAVCQPCGTRRRFEFAVCLTLAHGKQWRPWGPWRQNPRASHVIHVRRVPAGWHMAKHHIRRVLVLGTRWRAWLPRVYCLPCVFL